MRDMRLCRKVGEVPVHHATTPVTTLSGSKKLALQPLTTLTASSSGGSSNAPTGVSPINQSRSCPPALSTCAFDLGTVRDPIGLAARGPAFRYGPQPAPQNCTFLTASLILPMIASPSSL